MVLRRHALLGLVVVLAAGGCSASHDTAETPGLADRGTVLTTVKPVRQDLANRLSLAGKVTINPVFGLVAPVDGELRFPGRTPPRTPAKNPLWVASVWHDGYPQHVEIPVGSVFAGRLMDDHAQVTKGMPVISATHSGYGIVADIDSAQAYRVSGAISRVQAQIKNGPGPFTCTTLGTIAALPAGTVPEPVVAATTPAAQNPSAPAAPDRGTAGGATGGSEATGMRLVCVPPAGVKLINGADVTIEVVTDRASKVLVLPVEAVAGAQGRGKVDLVVGDGQTRKTIDVTLGISDGKVIEIKKGLTGDETVAVPGPNLPTVAPTGGGTNG
ncbi:MULTISPECIES: efflux RND transporter periplasmic adaptor subunit [unclassified Actinoplanes]|uniref:efflux RND transporter periplasmic adaptor subunit n=1 Tax=unclassified Actinoplanes TaxID=2626549 RepID=UPI000313C9D8|nr:MULTISPECIES: efflux RND transporter periplasmic adaptor subunit [unclassified Actinoplanes]